MTADHLNKLALIDKIITEWADRGKLVEGGWAAYVAISGLEEASDLQRWEMRKAYMLGAQHLFACIQTTMDPGTEPMSLIHEELEAFRKSLTN